MESRLSSVLEYGDFRSYLRDHLATRKLKKKGFGLAHWARRLGLRSHSTLVMILNGQRKPSPALVEELIRDLSLTGKEAAFFRDLVLLETCKRGSVTESSIKERLALLHPKRNFRDIDAEVFGAISNWYVYAIRELVELPDFREDIDWIQKRLRIFVTKKDIQRALLTLEKLHLLERGPSGHLKYNQYVKTTFDVPDAGLKKFHEQVLRIARDSLHSVPVEAREISGGTITLREEDIPRAKAILRQALHDVAELGKNGGDEVYQAEIVLVPLTKKEVSKCII